MSNQSFSAVTPSDSVALTTPVRSFYIGATGNISVLGFGDTVATIFYAVPAGWFTFPAAITQVMATGTTATEIVALANGSRFAS